MEIDEIDLRSNPKTPFDPNLDTLAYNIKKFGINMFLSVSGLRMDLTVVAATTQAQGLPANSPQQLTHPSHPVGPLGPHTKGGGDQQCRGVTCPTHLPLPQEGPEVLGQSARTRRSLWSRASVRSRENPPQGSLLEPHSGGKTAGEMEERSSVTIAYP